MGKNNAKPGKGKDKGKGNPDKAEGAKASLKGAQSINARHILCEKHQKKEKALEKLRDGAKFDEVAREFSEDKARQGGALGWKPTATLDDDFVKAALSLEPSTTSNPKYVELKGGHGHHIIMLEGRK